MNNHTLIYILIHRPLILMNVLQKSQNKNSLSLYDIGNSFRLTFKYKTIRQWELCSKKNKVIGVLVKMYVFLK